MTDAILPISGAVPSAARAAPAAGGSVQDLARTLDRFGSRMFAPEANGPAAMLSGVEQSMLTSMKPADYVRATLVATDVSMHVSMSMMKFHVSASLGNAATGLFNTLLKNRE